MKHILIQEEILHIPDSNLLLTIKKYKSFDDYMLELRKLSKDCELEGLQGLLLRDMLIIGLNYKKLQKH